MSAIDYIIFAIILLAGVTGALKGFVHQVGTVAGIILAILVCRFFGGTVADYIVSSGSEHATVYRAIVYVLVFVTVYLVVRVIASLFTKAMGALHIRAVDRVAGALFRMLAWMLFMSVMLNVYLALVPVDRAKFNTPDRPWRPFIARLAPKVLGFITT
ncbi:MAG: CvpA family protein [Muribaculaceae bacterium]|nr:CvpA family protein [Muribaculaceae bacterium]MDE6197538.1 CvpA family protein [Muribaculaceae bacterium]